jgi:hypothetical protein
VGQICAVLGIDAFLLGGCFFPVGISVRLLKCIRNNNITAAAITFLIF